MTIRNNKTGLPDLIDAFHEALSCHGNPEHFHWSHPLVYKAACQTGFSTLRMESPAVSLETFKLHYQKLKNELLQSFEKSSNDSLSLIDQLSRQLELDPALLYYLTRPKGSYMRSIMREKCISQLSKMNRFEDLPI